MVGEGQGVKMLTNRPLSPRTTTSQSNGHTNHTFGDIIINNDSVLFEI